MSVINSILHGGGWQSKTKYQMTDYEAISWLCRHRQMVELLGPTPCGLPHTIRQGTSPCPTIFCRLPLPYDLLSIALALRSFRDCLALQFINQWPIQGNNCRLTQKSPTPQVNPRITHTVGQPLVGCREISVTKEYPSFLTTQLVSN